MSIYDHHPEQDPIPLGLIIRQMRNEKGLTQEKLAELCGEGVTVSYIAKLESTKSNTNPKIKTIVKLAKGLDVDPFTLLFFLLKTDRMPKDTKQIAMKMHELIRRVKEKGESEKKSNKEPAFA